VTEIAKLSSTAAESWPNTTNRLGVDKFSAETAMIGAEAAQSFGQRVNQPGDAGHESARVARH
jgi:hypothetical protein